VLERPRRAMADARHPQPPPFRPWQPLELELTLQRPPGSVRIYYRHVNQGERFETALMRAEGNRFRFVIPAAYTNSPYPLQYYFEIKHAPASASLHPGFGPDLTNQPYYVVRQA